MGFVSDKIGRKASAIICTMLHAGAILWLTWLQDLRSLYLFAMIFGFAYGGMATAITTLIGDTFGLSKIGTILGILEITSGIGQAVGPAIGGLIFDINTSYFLAFQLGAGVMIIATLLIASVRRELGKDIPNPPP